METMRAGVRRHGLARRGGYLASRSALSGAGYAALTLPRGSVGTVQLKRGAVTGVKVKENNAYPR